MTRTLARCSKVPDANDSLSAMRGGLLLLLLRLPCYCITPPTFPTLLVTRLLLSIVRNLRKLHGELLEGGLESERGRAETNIMRI